VGFLRSRHSVDAMQTCVATAQTHLDQVLRDSERSIAVLSQHFQDLAHDCDLLMTTTRELVTATQSSGAQDVLPFMRRIYGDCEAVLHLRLEAAGGVAELLSREQDLLEELEKPSRAQQATSRMASIIAVMLRIEIARLGHDGEGFTYMSGELEQASDTISKSVDVLQELIQTRQGRTPARRIGIEESRSQARRNLALIESGREDALQRADRALQDFEQLPVSFEGCVKEVSSNIGRVTGAVQMQDLTRQQTEHVGAALRALRGDITSSLKASQTMAALRVQLEQAQNVCRTTEGWIGEIEQCAASILRLGDEELLAIMKQIVCLEISLEQQGQWVAQFESEFHQYDRVNEQEFGEFETMMAMVRKHLEQSQSTSDHLQLLNLNSMVAAHNVGTQAASVLQITNSISRLAADWRGLTTQSVDSMEEMLAAASSRGEQARSASSSTRTAIAAIQEETQSTLGSLRSISALGVRCQREGQEMVKRMHARMTQVDDSLAGLRGVVTGIKAAVGAIERALEQGGNPDPLQLSETERRAIEQQFGSAYTSEIERQVLRSVLFGEVIPPSSPMASVGDIELF